MSPILTTRHHHSLRSRPRHSGPRSGETSALRLARLAANLGNGIIQRTPSDEIPVEEESPGGVPHAKEWGRFSGERMS
jgi:hypothetical protein